jgi:hypothetical protein
MKKVLIAIVSCIIVFVLYVSSTIALRLSPEAINTRFTIKLENPSTELYVRVPYGNYIFSYMEGPNVTGVYGAYPAQVPTVKCRTIIEKDNKIVLDTDKYQFNWNDPLEGTSAIRITSKIANPNNSAVYLKIKPGF